MRRFFFVLFFVLGSINAVAQVTLEDVRRDPNVSANRYRAYPAQERSTISKAPRGYKPFYAYYIGRHGSRFLDGKTSYTHILEVFETADAADALTPKGKDVLRRLRVIAADAAGRYGYLTRTGQRQLYGISERMYENFPEIFAKDGLKIEAISTNVRRVIGTMEAYCERMKQLNPSASITMTPGSPIYGEWGSDTPGEKDVWDADTPFGRRYRQIKEEYTKPDRLMGVLFTNPSYPDSIGVKRSVIQDELFSIASIAQSVDLEFLDYNLYDIFTPEELYELSVIRNYEVYVKYGSSPETAPVKNHMIHKPMELMIERAEGAWKDGSSDVFMVFCHDGNVGPYAAALKIPWAYSDTVVDPKEVSDVYSSGTAVSMACNLQFIFYRNRKGKVLVKVLLNEREAVLPIGVNGTPYNDWETFKSFALSK